MSAVQQQQKNFLDSFADAPFVATEWDEDIPDLAGLTMMDCNEEELSPEPRSSLFTNSGNAFCFDYLSPVTPLVQPVKKQATRKRAPENTTIPVSNNTEEGQLAMQTDFLASFKKGDDKVPSAITTLESLFRTFPKLCYLQKCGNEVDLCFVREELMQQLKLATEQGRFPKIVFTSFERGLKHAGMEVTQSTHGHIPIKKWRVKAGFVKSPTKKIKKRKDSADFILPIKKKKANQLKDESPANKM